jgi:hypothetical protein
MVRAEPGPVCHFPVTFLNNQDPLERPNRSAETSWEPIADHPHANSNRSDGHGCQDESRNPSAVTTGCTHEGYQAGTQSNERKPK